MNDEKQAGTQAAIQAEAQADRVKGMGDWLIEVHDWFRAELAGLRRQAEAGEPLTPPGPELRTNCLAFCTALTRHHTGEDGGVFPMLAQQVPELAPVLERLEREHAVVARIQHEIEALARDGADPERLVADLDRLAGELTAHLRYEEEQLVTALNRTPAPAR